MRLRAVRLAIIVTLSQLSWFACVLGAASNSPWIGPAAGAGTLAFNLLVLEKPLNVLKLAVVGALLGLAVETPLILTGLVSYSAPGTLANLPPLWLIALWVVFSTLPNTALAQLHGRVLLQAVLGLVGAPLAYLAGERLGAMSFIERPTLGLAAIGLLWAVAFPTLMAAAKRIERGPRDRTTRVI
jgi:hypothetical protein